MTDHLDPDALSAALDGMSPDAAGGHLDGCPACRVRLADLASARRAVSAPIPPLAAASGAARERAIAQALAAADEWLPAAAGNGAMPPVAAAAPASVSPSPVAPPPPRVAPRQARWWVATSAVAAMLLLVVGAMTLVNRGSKGTTNTALSAGAPSSSTDQATSRSGAGAAAGDLGPVAGIDALRAKVTASLPKADQPAGTAGTANSLTAGRSAAPNTPSGATATGGADLAPKAVGSFVCEADARAARPQLGVVVYAANLVYAGTPAVVLGFAPTASDPPGALLVLAPQSSCRVLVETTLS